MDKIEIKVLGTFDVLVNGKSIVSCFAKSQKGSVLMRYLLLHRDRAVSHNDLYDVLWPDEDRRNPESALKTLVSRLRDSLNRCHKGLDESILSGRGTFQWNGNYPITLDLADFERLCAALTNVQALTPQTREMFESVLSLYKGDLYAKEAQDMWVISSSVYLRNLYEETVYRYLELLKADKDYDGIVAASRKALEINAYSEKLHIALMEALVKTKRHNEALTHYKHAKNIHLRYLGVQPPKNILDFYTSIIQSGQVLDMDIDRIRDELRAYDTGKGAFVCEYSVFKEIYNLELRSFERTKRVLFLALIMLKSTKRQADGTVETR